MSRIGDRFRLFTLLSLAFGLLDFGSMQSLAQVSKITYSVSFPVIGFDDANSVALDSAGNLYVTDISRSLLYKETLNSDGTYTQTTIPAGGQPFSVAVDSSGNLYVANGSGAVYKETPSGGSYTESTVASGFTYAVGTSVDSSGNVYVVDYGTGKVYKETYSGGSYTQSTVAIGLGVPEGSAAIDSTGNVYIVDSGNNRVVKETLSGGTYAQSVVVDTTTINGTPTGVAVDPFGKIILSYSTLGTYVATLSGGSYSFNQISSLTGGEGLTTDASGTIYVAGTESIVKLVPNELAEDSGAVNFGSIAIGGDGGTQTVTFTFDVSSTLASTPFSVSTQGVLSADFQPASTQPADVCTAGKTYAAGDTCSVTAHFSPTRPGARYGAIVLFQTSSAPVGTAYLQGEGTGPQVSYSPGLFEGLFEGSIVLAYYANDNVLFSAGFDGAEYYNPGNRTTYGVDTGFDTGYKPTPESIEDIGISVDGAGNVITYNLVEATPNNNQIWIQSHVFNPNLPAPTTAYPDDLRYGLASVTSIADSSPSATIAHAAVDGSGSVYFSDPTGNQVLKESWNHGSYNQQTVVDTGFNKPGDIAVDGSGNVFVLDTGNGRVVEETLANGAYTASTVIDSLVNPQGLTIDKLGNLYITVAIVSPPLLPSVIKLVLVDGKYQPATIAASGDGGVDVDAAGNLVVGSEETDYIELLDVADPQPLQFKSTAVGTKSSDSPQIVTITNNGNEDLVFSVPTSGNNPAITAGFTLDSSSTCSILSTSSSTATLAAGASCTLAVNFIPTQSGTNTGTLTLTDNHLNAPGSTQVIPLNGTATGTATVSATLTPAPYDYGSVNVGATATQVFTLTNTGTSPITIASASIPNTVFTIASSTCTATLAAGATCTYIVAFAPTVAGAQTTVFSVGYDSTGVTTALSGTGVVPTTAPQAALTPTTADFGSVTAGTTSAAQTFVLANAGTAALPITSIGLTGANASSFTLAGNTCGTSLAASGSCNIMVTFSPSAAGSFSASLSVVDSIGTQTSVLSGTGLTAPVSAPQATLTPATANFGSVNVGSSSAGQTFTLANAGTAALPITSIGVTGKDASVFSVAANTCGTSLAAGGSCTIAIAFSPAAVGSDTASLAVVDSMGTQSSALTGTATAAPAASDFTIAATPPTQTASAGTSVTYSVQLGSVDPTNPFTSAVTLSATGLPAGATAGFSPASMVPGSSQSTMTVTLASLTAADAGSTRPLLAGMSLASIAMIFVIRRRSRRGMLQLMALVILSVAAMTTTLTGCGSKTGFAIPGPTSPGSTTSTITITGISGSTTHSTTVTITVQQ
jgi:trimeric autotransporter adhesin